MKKPVKKPTKKVTKKKSILQVYDEIEESRKQLFMALKPEYVTELEDEVTRLAKRVAELESTTLKVGQQVRYNEPKEPETFEDCVKGKDGYNTGLYGTVLKCESLCHSQVALENGSAVPSEKRAKQLAAIAKMMTVADALKGDYGSEHWEITYNTNTSNLEPMFSYCRRPLIRFPNMDIAKKAIKILGEDTIKTAFGI